MDEAEGKVVPVRRAEENYRLAKKYMDAYVDSLVDEEKVRKENIVLIECVDKIIAEMREIRNELTEIKQQNKAFAENMQYQNTARPAHGWMGTPQPYYGLNAAVSPHLPREAAAAAPPGAAAAPTPAAEPPAPAAPPGYTAAPPGYAYPVNAKQFEDLLDDDDFQHMFRAMPPAGYGAAPVGYAAAPPVAHEGGASLPQPAAVPVAPPPAAIAPGKKEKKPKEDKPKNKVVSIVSNVMFYLCMGLLLVGAITFAQSEDVNKSLFGFRYYYIKTASMEPVLPVGSIVITKVTEPSDIKVGDDITVYVGEGKSETYLTHRVVEITNDQNGELAFRTKGVNAKSNDPSPYNASLVAGKVVFCIPLLGTVMTFVQTQLVFVIAIFALLLLLSFMLKLMFSKKDPEAEPASTTQA